MQISRIIYGAAMEIPVKLQGFHYREASKYITITKGEYERMSPVLAQHLLWKRLKT